MIRQREDVFEAAVALEFKDYLTLSLSGTAFALSGWSFLYNRWLSRRKQLNENVAKLLDINLDIAEKSLGKPAADIRAINGRVGDKRRMITDECKILLSQLRNVHVQAWEKTVIADTLNLIGEHDEAMRIYRNISVRWLSVMESVVVLRNHGRMLLRSDLRVPGSQKMKDAVTMLNREPKIPSAYYQLGETYQMWAVALSRLAHDKAEVKGLFDKAAEAYKHDFDQSRQAESLEHLKTITDRYEAAELPQKTGQSESDL